MPRADGGVAAREAADPAIGAAAVDANGAVRSTGAEQAVVIDVPLSRAATHPPAHPLDRAVEVGSLAAEHGHELRAWRRAPGVRSDDAELARVRSSFRAPDPLEPNAALHKANSWPPSPPSASTPTVRVDIRELLGSLPSSTPGNNRIEHGMRPVSARGDGWCPRWCPRWCAGEPGPDHRQVRNQPGVWDFMISYTQRNEASCALAQQLRAELIAHGKTVWLDVMMKSRDMAAMREGVENSQRIIAIVSGDEESGDHAYFRRQCCLQELRWAQAANKPVQPIVDSEDKRKITDMQQLIPADLAYLKELNWVHMDRLDPRYFNLGVTDIIGDRGRWTKWRVLSVVCAAMLMLVACIVLSVVWAMRQPASDSHTPTGEPLQPRLWRRQHGSSNAAHERHVRPYSAGRRWLQRTCRHAVYRILRRRLPRRHAGWHAYPRDTSLRRRQLVWAPADLRGRAVHLNQRSNECTRGAAVQREHR